MILQFSVANYRSFKEKSTLSLLASNYDKDTREVENIILNEKFNYRILKSAVIYGANAGGKSKFIEALIFMRHFVLMSSKDTQKGDPIAIEPFRLNAESIEQGSEFEIVFFLENNLYRYGFEVDKDKVVAEWLYHKTKTKENELFYRDYQEIIHNTKKFTKLDTLVKEKLVRDNALLISVLAQFNDLLAETILYSFKELKVISGLKEEGYLNDTMLLSKDSKQKKRILTFLQNADIGIDDFKLKKHTFENLNIDSMDDVPKELKDAIKGLNSYIKKTMKDENQEKFSDVIMYHKQFDEEGKYLKDVEFSLLEDESSGTRKYFALIGQIIKIIDIGGVLFVDELDSKIHPNLVCKIISIFNSKKLNPNNAQLVFNSHDTNLLSSGLFRRDQIWFAKKDTLGASKLYSLADFKTDEVRKNEAFENNYIRGKYGAVPFLGDFDNIIQ
ncbi:MAG: ATP-binding protein [Salinivirgaceae bacterium]|nr:ATP-binding protein [Salinivirgaceae bacterium]